MLLIILGVEYRLHQMKPKLIIGRGAINYMMPNQTQICAKGGDPHPPIPPQHQAVGGGYSPPRGPMDMVSEETPGASAFYKEARQTRG